LNVKKFRDDGPTIVHKLYLYKDAFIDLNVEKIPRRRTRKRSFKKIPIQKKRKVFDHIAKKTFAKTKETFSKKRIQNCAAHK